MQFCSAMKLFTCLLVFHIFDITTSLKSKSVNLALETVIEFDNQDNSGDVQFINNVQTFLDKIKTIINKSQNGRRSNRSPDEKFTGFLKNACAILRKYDDDDLEDVFTVIDNEVRKYHYKGCKFYELLQNNDVRRYVAMTLNDVKSKSAKEIRHVLNKVFRVLVVENYDRRIKGLLEYINSLYRNDAKYKFRSFLSNLDSYQSKSKRANLDLIKIIREGVRTILFDHYTDLNQNARKELKLKIETFWKQLSSNPHYIKHNTWNIKYTRSDREKYGRFNVEHRENNLTYPLNMSLANASMAYNTTKSTNKWTTPTKLPFNLTRTTLRTTADTTISLKPETTKTTDTTTFSKPTKTKKGITKIPKKPKKPKRPKLSKIDLDYSTEVKHRFATRYGKDITRRPHIYRTKSNARVHTLWEEKLVVRSAEKSVRTIISNHKAVINVESTKRPKYHKKNHERNRLRPNRHRNQQKRFDVNHGRITSPRYRVYERSPVTRTFKKSISHPITSEEGLTIESFEHVPSKMISFRKTNNNDTFGLTNASTVDSNVMRRINDMERELNEMKSKIKVNVPVTNVLVSNAPVSNILVSNVPVSNIPKTTTTERDEENYVLDFWEGTPKDEIIRNQITSNKTTSSILTTKPNEKRTENVTEIKSSTVVSMVVAKPKTVFIPVDYIKAFENITREAVLKKPFKKASFNVNKTKVVPFSEQIDNNFHLKSVNNTIQRIEDSKNDLLLAKTNFKTTPVLEIDEKSNEASTLEKNVTIKYPSTVNVTEQPTILVNETIRKKLEEIFKNITTPSYFEPTALHNDSDKFDIKDPFKDMEMDDMDFL